ncbi:hypothetical protein BCV69DRAFT_164799 [Microstroma glucosiphilum]|uniref:Uncharacterized protein n=1 Tax=Pseudomicrostroma glucosiphilum TaxID=1684307 RepID=A0A316U7Q0_9BASI|nr:hypothetical protein BCV69DRAFT_164799 [Pseudomicrostroma glucosiphilum]PWN21267.1 hypothetical protein BCV69DRAFT_164799 [Pseudomicrostroma glucosiphilum]
MASAHTFERSHQPQRRNRKQDVQASPSGTSYLPAVPLNGEPHGSEHSDRSSAGSMLQLDLEGLDLGGPLMPFTHCTPPSEGHSSPKKSSWSRNSPQWQPQSPSQQSNTYSGSSSNSKKMSAALNLARRFTPNATGDARRTPFQSTQQGIEIDSFVAHLRDDCSGTNEILGSDAILSANAVGVSASTNRGGALMLDTGALANIASTSTSPPHSPPSHSINIPTPQGIRTSSSAFAEHRGSPPGKRAPWQETISEQVLGGFASLGVPSSSTSQHQASGSATGKSRPTLAASARSTSRSGGLVSYMGDSGVSEATPPTSPMWSTDSYSKPRWQTMIPVKRQSEASKVLELMSIDELSQHAIDVGHLGDWEGASLVPADGPYEGEESVAASWRAARQTQQKRQWICAPVVPDDELAAERTIVVSDCKASTSARAALPSNLSRGPPLAFSGLASFELRFLRGRLADRRVHLATPAQLKEVYGKYGTTGSRQGQERKPRSHSWGTTERPRIVKKLFTSEGSSKFKANNGGTSQALRRTRSRPALQLDPFGLPDLKDSIARSSRRLSFDASATQSSSNYPSLLTPTHLRSGDFLAPGDALGSTKADVKPSNAFSGISNGPFANYAMDSCSPTASGSTSRRGPASPVKPEFHTGMASSFSSPPTATPLQLSPSLCSEVEQERQAEAAAFAKALPALPITSDAGSSATSSPSKTHSVRTRMTSAPPAPSATLVSQAAPAEHTGPRLRKEPSKIGGWLKKKMGGGSSSANAGSKTSSSTITAKKDEAEQSSLKAPPANANMSADPFAAYRDAERRPALKDSGVRAHSFYHMGHNDRDLDVLSDMADDPHSLFAANSFPFGKPNGDCPKRGSKLLQKQGEAAPSWSSRGSLMPPYAAGRRASASDDDIVAHAGQAARNLSFGTIGKKDKSRSTLGSKCRAAAYAAGSPALKPSGLAASSQPRISSPLAQRAALISEKPILSPPETAKPGPLQFAKGTALTRLASDESKLTLGSRSLQLLGIENVPADALSMIIPLPLSSTSGRQQRYLRLNYVPFGHEHRAEYRFNSDGSSKSSPHLGSHPPCANGTMSFSPPSWYHRLGAASIGHTKPISSEESYPYEGAGSAAKPTYLFGAGPAAAHDAQAKSAAVPNRQQTGPEAFRVTAMVLAAPDEEGEAELRPPSKLLAAAMRFSHSSGTAKSGSGTGRTQGDDQSTLERDRQEEDKRAVCWLPEPTPFPIVLVTCCGEYVDFVSEGWEALGLGGGPIETSGDGVRHEEDDEEEEDDRSALFGVADLVAAGCAAVMDL